MNFLIFSKMLICFSATILEAGAARRQLQDPQRALSLDLNGGHEIWPRGHPKDPPKGASRKNNPWLFGIILPPPKKIRVAQGFLCRENPCPKIRDGIRDGIRGRIRGPLLGPLLGGCRGLREGPGPGSARLSSFRLDCDNLYVMFQH